MDTTLLQWTCGLPGKGFFTAYIAQPFYNLTNLDNFLGLVIAWSIVLGIWFYLYYSAPCTVLNCKDGFIDATTTTASSIGLYWAVTVFIIMICRTYYCNKRQKLINSWRNGTARAPRWLNVDGDDDE